MRNEYTEKPCEARKATNRLLEMIENYTLDPAAIVLMCLKWMSEDDVKAMCKANEIDLDDRTDDDYLEED